MPTHPIFFYKPQTFFFHTTATAVRDGFRFYFDIKGDITGSECQHFFQNRNTYAFKFSVKPGAGIQRLELLERMSTELSFSAAMGIEHDIVKNHRHAIAAQQ